MKTLQCSHTNRWFAGIFGGLGETFDIDPMVLRLAAIFVGMVTGVLPLLITYVVGWIAVPKETPVHV